MLLHIDKRKGVKYLIQNKKIILQRIVRLVEDSDFFCKRDSDEASWNTTNGTEVVTPPLPYP